MGFDLLDGDPEPKGYALGSLFGHLFGSPFRVLAPPRPLATGIPLDDAVGLLDLCLGRSGSILCLPELRRRESLKYYCAGRGKGFGDHQRRG